MELSKLAHFNDEIFQKLERKCRLETKFGKVANILLFVLFRSILIAKSGRAFVQKYTAWFKGKPKELPVSDCLPPSRAWHYPLVNRFPNSNKLRVTIIAELSIPQCKRYRVEQKVAAFQELGHSVNVTSFTDINQCWRLMAFSDVVIFYRTPYWKPVQGMVAECKRLGVPTVFDIDDLVFDLEIYRSHPVFKTMEPDRIQGFLDGALNYQKCLSACDYFIASTPTLFAHMQNYNKGKGWIIENALDETSLKVSKISSFQGKHSRSKVFIGYGSGTKSHDQDFAIAERALLRILEECPEVQVVLFGYLNISSEFERFKGRVERNPLLDAQQYLLCIADLDINLAPLTLSVFNDAKSNIKYLEAAANAVPTIASPSASFKEVIRHGENGFLADTENEWYESLIRLVKSPELRHSVGENARASAFAHYSPIVTRDRVADILTTVVEPHAVKPGKRILFVNCLFDPFSFGGATLVVERLAESLSTDHNVAVFTGNTLPELPSHAVFKYEAKGALVYSMKHDLDLLIRHELRDAAGEHVFRQVLQEFQPDIVHFHAIQGLSIEMLNICKQMGIPSAVTMHDAWWFCSRQFMQMENGKYCGQMTVNYRVCGNCVHSLPKVTERQTTLLEALAKVGLIFTPSKYQQDFVQKNLPSARNIYLHKNDFSLPGPNFRKTPSVRKRIAFLGGINAEHKGYFILKQALEGLDVGNYELLLVDLNLKLTSSPSKFEPWNIKGALTVVPPFSKSDMDAFYANVDVLVTPSLIPESFGLAVREALVRNVWVIASKAGALAEDIEEDGNGNVVAMGDIEGLRNAIAKVLSKDLSTAAKASVSEHSQSKAALDYYDLVWR